MKPKLRNKSYYSIWQTQQFTEIAAFSKGQGYSKSDLMGEGDPIILYGQMYTKYKTIISDAHTFVKTKKGNVISKGGEIIVPASGETSEDIAIASVVAKPGILLGGDINVIEVNQEKIDPVFAALAITYSKTHNELSKMAQGKSVVHLHNSSISKAHLTYPELAEQQEIVSFIIKADHQIESIESEIEKLRQLKVASLQAMFPQEGETVPRLRFKGFDGDWKLNHISSVIELRRGLTYSPNDICDKNQGVLVLRSSNINGDTFQVDENDVYVTPSAVNIPLIKPGELLLTAANGSTNLVGKHCIFPEINEPAVHGGFMLAGKCINSSFLQAYFSAPWYQEALPSFIMGGNGTLGNFKASDFLNHKLLFPKDVKEAEKIGAFFLNLDKQIKFAEKKLEKLKQIKSACLDLMFV